MHNDERQTALSFIHRLGQHGLMPVKSGGIVNSETMAIAAHGWSDQQLRPYFEAANGWLEDVTGVTGMRGEYDDHGLAEELDEVVKVVGLQHDQWGGVAHDRHHTSKRWMDFIGEHDDVISEMHLADPLFATEMRRIAALAISACLAHRSIGPVELVP